MIVIHNADYNPRIDFLICKNLLLTLPIEYDERCLRKCFVSETNDVEKYEREIIDIKHYFVENDLSNFTTQNIYALYSLITRENTTESMEVVLKVSNIDDVIKLAKEVSNSLVADKNVLFQLLLLKMYFDSNHLLLIPYRNICKHLYYSALLGDAYMVECLFGKLLSKRDHYCLKHTLAENEKAVKSLFQYSSEFIRSVGAQSLYYYGSLAVGDCNEYSDLDILVVFQDETDITKVEVPVKDFWKSKINIPFDVLITTESAMDKRTTKDMKATMKKVGGV